MAEGQFILYIRKVIVNPLLARKQMSVEIIHPEMAGVKKSAIKAEIAKKFKIQNQEERIAVFGLKARFGGGRSSGFVTVYDDADARNKYDAKVNKYRVSKLLSNEKARHHRALRDCLCRVSFLFICQIFNYIL